MKQTYSRIIGVLKICFILTFPAFLTVSTTYAADAVVVPDNTLHSPAGMQITPSQGKGLSKRKVASGHIMVQIAPETDTSTFLKRARGVGLRKLKQLRGTQWYSMGIDTPGLGVRQAVTNAMGLPGVLRAVADPMVTINDQIPPSDPYYLDDPDPGVDCDIIEDPACQAEDLVDQWGLFKVMAETAWTSSTGSSDVVIAIVDSGVDIDHDDLWANIWTNPGEIASNGIDDDGNGFIDDVHGWDYSGSNVGGPDDDPSSEDNNPDILQGGQWVSDFTALPLGYRYDGDASVGDGIDNNLEYYYLYGFFTMDIGVFHGTTVAGVVSAMANNINPESGLYEGFAGTCWHCTVMPLRMINAEGEAFGSDAAEAIRYAADNGAHIINASWGIAPGSATAAELVVLEEAIQYATGKGVIVVAAAGNSGVAGLHFPASMPETIAVGSSSWLDVRSDFSSYASPGGQEILDVVAPGEAIWNAGVISAYDAWVMNYWLLFPEFDYEPWHPGDDVYIGADGTSFAAPLVSGYLGLILSKNPCATPVQVREILRSNAVDIGTSGYDTQTGFGRVEMVVPDLECSTGGNQSPFAGFIYLANDLVVDFADQSSDADGTIVVWSWDFGGDGLSTLQNPTHTFSSAGTYNTTLTVTDDVGSTDTISQDVTVNAGTSNTPPAASFSYVCKGRDCSFSDLSSDQDVGDYIFAWTWDFGNGVTSNIQHPSLSYDSQGNYSVTLVVTDANNATGSVSTSIRVKNRGNTSGSADGTDTGSTLESERGKKKCSDGIDNDGDGLIDGSDPDCR